MTMLPYGRQTIEDDDIEAVVDVLKSGWLTCGPKVAEFENALADKVGAAYAVACNSGTAALHLSALALGIGQGDAVIVPTMTFLATANAVRYVGAEVIFSDVDPDTGLMTVDHLEMAMNQTDGRDVKAIFPVHLNGQCVDMQAISLCAERNGLAVVDDGCHAIGATYQTNCGDVVNVGACNNSDMTVFSFHPVKTIAMGEGGAITTNDEKLYKRLCLLRNHGMVRSPDKLVNSELSLDDDGQPNPWYYEMQEIGFNYRVSDIHCALGLSQLNKLDRFIEKRRSLARQYDELLFEFSPVIQSVSHVAGCNPAWHLYVILVDFDAINMSRAHMMTRLSECGVGTQVHYLPVHLQPYYRERYGKLDLPGSEIYYKRQLSLPLFPAMNDTDVKRVVNCIREIINT